MATMGRTSGVGAALVPDAQETRRRQFTTAGLLLGLGLGGFVDGIVLHQILQ